MKRHKNKWITLTGRSFLPHFYSTCYLARSTIFKTLTPEASKGFRKTKFICFRAGILSLLGPGPFPSMHAEASCNFFSLLRFFFSCRIPVSCLCTSSHCPLRHSSASSLHKGKSHCQSPPQLCRTEASFSLGDLLMSLFTRGLLQGGARKPIIS